MVEFDILVVATRKRPSLITEYLNDIPYKINYTNDYELDRAWKPNLKYENYVENHTGAYRCFRGHQDVLKMMEKNIALVFEDDAVPNREDWIDIVKQSLSLLSEFDIVSLHGRNIMGISKINEIGKLKFVELNPVPFLVYRNRKVVLKKSFGSLAYIIKRKEADKIINTEYDGYPMDLYLVNEFKACILEPSPFNHDRRHGTLIG